MIEQSLCRIADALERIANRMDGGQVPPPPAATETISDTALAPAVPAKVKAKAKKEVEAPKETTTDDIAAALRAFVTVKGKDEAVKILKKYNAARLSEIKPEDFSKVLADLKV